MTGSDLASAPLTGMPRATMMRATADMPTPPMPMKWTRPRDSRACVPCWGWVIALLLPAVLVRALLFRTLLFRTLTVPAVPVRGRDPEDEIGHAPVGVADAELFGAGCHPVQPVRVQQQGNDVPADPVGGEGLVIDDQCASHGDQARGVQRLLAVADGQGHEDGGDAHGGHLADRGGSGTGQQQVR